MDFYSNRKRSFYFIIDWKIIETRIEPVDNYTQLKIGLWPGNIFFKENLVSNMSKVKVVTRFFAQKKSKIVKTWHWLFNELGVNMRLKIESSIEKSSN